jgi:uncharacterized protein
MIHNDTTGETLARQIEICDTFLSRGRGLMFRRPLDESKALIFVEARESITATSIHMFFVFFPIAVIWLDGQKRVVDAKLARPFRPYYAAASAARYFIEGHPNLLEKVHPGDQIRWMSSGERTS